MALRDTARRCRQASANELCREGGWVLALVTGGCDLPDIPAISSGGDLPSKPGPGLPRAAPVVATPGLLILPWRKGFVTSGLAFRSRQTNNCSLCLTVHLPCVRVNRSDAQAGTPSSCQMISFRSYQPPFWSAIATGRLLTSGPLNPKWHLSPHRAIEVYSSPMDTPLTSPSGRCRRVEVADIDPQTALLTEGPADLLEDGHQPVNISLDRRLFRFGPFRIGNRCGCLNTAATCHKHLQM